MTKKFGIQKDFKQRFILTEEKLRKINDILESYGERMEEEYNVSYLILNKNDHYLRTNEIDEIFELDNSRDSTIVALVVIIVSLIIPNLFTRG